ncbi:hypothetical protein KPA07_05235 [Corynebacterium aurimucosum]|nr:hypothetical protein [Corynebacterium aurimucosum]MBU5654317.1 hypothetical protein [Corynebacterium aurimucosum]QQU92354.1 hypothetical protein I6I67_08895 [Corynebacterium aurimucosum]
MNYEIHPSYKVTNEGTVPADDARTITADGKVAGTVIYNDWNNTAVITRFVNGDAEITYTPCESKDQLDEVIRNVF